MEETEFEAIAAPADYVRNLIATRCPELTDADLALITSAEPSAETPLEITGQVLDVIDHMMTRLDELEDAVGVNREDDDAAERR